MCNKNKKYYQTFSDSQEGEVLDPYGEWVPVEKAPDKDGADSRKFHPPVATVSTSVSANETLTAAATEAVEIKPVCVPDTDSVFPDPPLQVRNKRSLLFSCSCMFFCDIKAEL